jgi:hypothetical protein
MQNAVQAKGVHAGPSYCHHHVSTANGASKSQQRSYVHLNVLP